LNTEATQKTGSAKNVGTSETAENAAAGYPGSANPGPGNPSAGDPAIGAEAVLGRIAKLLAVPAAELSPRTVIRELVRESFMLVELVIDLQEEFGTYFTQEDLREIETIGELVTLMQASPRT
jgi:acyl carrier protein